MSILQIIRSAAVPVILAGTCVFALAGAPIAIASDAGAADQDQAQAQTQAAQPQHQQMQKHDQQAKQPMAHKNPMANAHAEPADEAIRVAEAAVCTKIEERAPVQAGEAFASDVNKLYCFTDVRNAGTSQQIYHRWYIGDRLVSEVPMQVRGPRWRCWSEKTIWPGWDGDCHVEIVNEAGERIGEVSFALTEADMQSDATPSDAMPSDAMPHTNQAADDS